MSRQLPRNHISQLDGIRCLAILMVLFGHWIQWNTTWQPVMHYTFNNGVTLFFVLSGFLITGILLDNKTHDEARGIPAGGYIRAFFVRRILRIFPIYYLTIAFLWLINDPFVRDLLPWLVTYTINIYQAIHQADLGKLVHLWSLSVEEQFYVAWPFFIAFIRRRYLPWLLSTLIALSVLYKAYTYYVLDNWMAGGYFTLGCMDALCLGALVAYLHRLSDQRICRALERFPAVIVWVVQAVLIIWTRYYGQQWFGFMFDTFLFAVFSALVINKAAGSGLPGPAGWLADNTVSRHIGKISYGIYLYHTQMPPLLNWITGQVGGINWNFPAYVLCSFLLVVLIAQLSWTIIEKPVNGLKRYFLYEGSHVKP